MIVVLEAQLPRAVDQVLLPLEDETRPLGPRIRQGREFIGLDRECRYPSALDLEGHVDVHTSGQVRNHYLEDNAR
jgi:hypothetical protein